jgi:hypothetical protein
VLTTTGGAGTATTALPRRAARPVYLPPQHGAWAFLALPLALAWLVSPLGPGPAVGWSAVLAVTWVGAYPLSYALLGLARPRQAARFRRPALVWSAVVVPPAVVLVAAHPWLVWVGAGYLALFAVNLWFARRRRERDLVNDAVLVAECTAVVPVAWAVAAGARGPLPPVAAVPVEVLVLAALCAVVLADSTLHVRSLIRERRNPGFARLSRAVSLAGVVVAAGLGTILGAPQGWWLVAGAAVLLVRAFAVRTTRPARIGLVELGAFAAVVVTAGLAT